MDKTSLQDILSATTLIAILTAISSKILDFIIELIKSRFTNSVELKKKWLEKINEKRLSVYEELYLQLDTLTDLDESNMINKVEESELFLKKNNLYIDRSIKSLFFSINDYFKQVVNNNIVRDVNQESSYLEEFKRLFNQ